jgi:hypothetical protein
MVANTFGLKHLSWIVVGESGKKLLRVFAAGLLEAASDFVDATCLSGFVAGVSVVRRVPFVLTIS